MLFEHLKRPVFYILETVLLGFANVKWMLSEHFETNNV